MTSQEIAARSQRIRERMELLDLNQAELGELIGLSQVTISQILSGKISKTRKINKLAQALQVSVEWLETGAGDKFIVDENSNKGTKIKSDQDDERLRRIEEKLIQIYEQQSKIYDLIHLQLTKLIEKI